VFERMVATWTKAELCILGRGRVENKRELESQMTVKGARFQEAAFPWTGRSSLVRAAGYWGKLAKIAPEWILDFSNWMGLRWNSTGFFQTSPRNRFENISSCKKLRIWAE
jgi:hypothetical protein